MMMLKLIAMPHVLHMKETIPMSRRTSNCGGCIFTGGPDVRDNGARTSNIRHC